jgi:serine/threonine-protein kinase 24/25/MST4
MFPVFHFAVTLILVFCRSYGSVWKGVHKSTGTVYAIKLVKVENNLKDIMKETEHMMECRSEYIVDYHDCFLKDDTLWVRACN